MTSAPRSNTASLFGDDPRFAQAGVPTAIVTTAELCDDLATYPMQITRWRKEMSFPSSIPNRRGHFDARAVIRWLGKLIKKDEQEAASTPAGSRSANDASPALEEQRHWKAKMLKLQYQAKSRQLVRKSDYVEAERARVEMTLAALIRLPEDAQEELGLSDAQREKLEESLRRAVEGLSTQIGEAVETDPAEEFADLDPELLEEGDGP